MNTFFLILIGLPALEILLMIKIGGKIGALNTISLVFLTAIIGVYFARIQGIQTLRKGIMSLYQNKIPIYELLSGASIALAAVLLIIPGFFSDLMFSLFLAFIASEKLENIFFERSDFSLIKSPVANDVKILS